MGLPDDHLLRVTPDMKTEHNYEKALKKLAELGVIGPYSEVTVAHDDYCSIYDGGLCDCECVIRVDRNEYATPIGN